MTKEEIAYIINDIVGYNVSTTNTPSDPTPLKGILYFNENRITDQTRNRYQFDFSNECIIIYYCKPLKIKVSEIPPKWKLYKQYDIINDTVYKYMTNPDDNEPIVDYVDFDSIDVIGIDDNYKGE